MAHNNHGCVRVTVSCSAYRMPQSRPAFCYSEGEPASHRYRHLAPIMPTSRIPFLLATLLLAPSAIAQSFSGFKPQQQVLNGPAGSPTSAANPQSVYATDLDGDGDADVLSASANDDKIAWYENLTVNQNGPASPGSFGPQQVITTSVDVPISVYATDLDGDGDADVLSASQRDDKVAWYENLTINLNGSASPGSFGAQQVITTSADGAFSVYATDLDGDGDADVLSASIFDDKIAWYENQGITFPTLLGLYAGSVPEDWNFETLPLPALMPAGGNVQFQFVYTRGDGSRGDLAIDNFCIF